MRSLKIKKEFCLLEYIQANSNKNVQNAFVSEFPKIYQQQSRFVPGKNFQDKRCLCGVERYGHQQQRKERSAGLSKTFTEPKKARRRTIWKPFAVSIMPFKTS